MARHVSIIIVTFHREQLLRRTLKSCLAQRGVDLTKIEIVVVDGSADASARGVIGEMEREAAELGVALRYVREPRPGISHSRNAGVAAASAALVAFIDDDEEATPEWLRHMLKCQGRYQADVVVGPVFPKFEVEGASRDLFWHWYFTADSRQSSGEVAKRGGGTHNCLLVKKTCCVTAEPFDPAFGLTGGEDTRFFRSVTNRGGKMVWCADGVIYEFVPAARSNWSYAVRRRLRENQLLMQSFLWSDPPHRGSLVAWMTIGLLQIMIFAPLAMALMVFDRASAKKYGIKAIGGIGKLLWLPGLTLIGYGDRGTASG